MILQVIFSRFYSVGILINNYLVLDFLVKNDYKGIMVCDDIGGHGNNFHPEMRDWWNSIELTTYKVANKYVSGTGTGIICFDGQEVLSDIRLHSE